MQLSADPGLNHSLLFPEETTIGPNRSLSFQYRPSAAAGPEVDIDHLRLVLATIVENPSIQQVGEPEDQEFMIRLGVEGLPLTPEGDIDGDAVLGTITAGLEKQYGENTVQVRSSEALSAQLAQTFATGSIIAIVVALTLMLLYVTFRFRFNFGVAAVIALLHDALATIAFVGVFQVEVNTAVVAAILTIIGYSINDTIVIYDRIRENETLLKGQNLALVMDTSVSQTLGRTFITSLTVFVAIFPLYLFGTGPVKDFSFAMVFGIIVGSYSSVFIASPIILVWQRALNKANRSKEMRLFGKSTLPETAIAGGREAKELPAEDPVALSEPHPHSGPVTRVQRVLDKKKKKKHRT